MIQGKKRTFRWSKEIEDWEDPETIERLNRWRQQVFRYVLRHMSSKLAILTSERRWLGLVRQPVISYERAENRWIIDLYERHHRANTAVNWNCSVKDFNTKFAGKNVEGARRNPRPARTKGSLMTQTHRIPEVAKYANIKIRGARQSTSPGQPSNSGKGHKREASDTVIDHTQTKTVKKEISEKVSETGAENDADYEGDRSGDGGEEGDDDDEETVG